MLVSCCRVSCCRVFCRALFAALSGSLFICGSPSPAPQNHFASEFVFNKYKDLKTCDVIERDPQGARRCWQRCCGAGLRVGSGHGNRKSPLTVADAVAPAAPPGQLSELTMLHDCAIGGCSVTPLSVGTHVQVAWSRWQSLWV